MNVIILTLVLFIVFYVIQKNSKFQNKEYPLEGASRNEAFTDTINALKSEAFTDTIDKLLNVEKPKEKRIKLIDTLKHISTSDKVTISNITEKWSLNKNVIDPDTNKQSIEIVRDVMDNIGFLSNHKFFIKNIENVYVMKDKNGNFRTIISCFIYDIKNFHTVKLIMDVVYFDNIMYINHIDLDESGIKNVLQHYDIKYKSQGILTNYNNFDQNVEISIDNYYKEKFQVLPLDDDKILDLSNTFSFTGLKKKIMPKNTPTKESPIFCNKESFDWDSKGINLPGSEDCIFNNPSIKHYPYNTYNAPGGIVNNVDINSYSWLKDPSRGHTVSANP